MGGGTGLLAAFAGGLLSFASPCLLPLIPAYLSVVTGLNVATINRGGRAHLRQVLLTAGGFVIGFTVVFVLLGLTVTQAGRLLTDHRALLTRLAGLVLLAMALFMVGSFAVRAPWLYGEYRWRPSLERFGPFAAPFAGVAFALGWTPCIGPVLTSVLAVAATTGQAVRGGALLGAYSAGLAVPFLVTALALDRVSGALGVVKRHLVALTVGSAALLGVFGVLLALDQLQTITVVVQRLFSSVF